MSKKLLWVETVVPGPDESLWEPSYFLYEDELGELGLGLADVNKHLEEYVEGFVQDPGGGLLRKIRKTSPEVKCLKQMKLVITAMHIRENFPETWAAIPEEPKKRLQAIIALDSL